LAYSATFQFHDFDEQTVDFNGSHWDWILYINT
jgi:hypothetical protein